MGIGELEELFGGGEEGGKGGVVVQGDRAGVHRERDGDKELRVGFEAGDKRDSDIPAEEP